MLSILFALTSFKNNVGSKTTCFRCAPCDAARKRQCLYWFRARAFEATNNTIQMFCETFKTRLVLHSFASKATPAKTKLYRTFLLSQFLSAGIQKPFVLRGVPAKHQTATGVTRLWIVFDPRERRSGPKTFQFCLNCVFSTSFYCFDALIKNKEGTKNNIKQTKR